MDDDPIVDSIHCDALLPLLMQLIREHNELNQSSHRWPMIDLDELAESVSIVIVWLTLSFKQLPRRGDDKVNWNES